jgi:hypothetical protein
MVNLGIEKIKLILKIAVVISFFFLSVGFLRSTTSQEIKIVNGKPIEVPCRCKKENKQIEKDNLNLRKLDDLYVQRTELLEDAYKFCFNADENVRKKDIVLYNQQVDVWNQLGK